MSHEDFLKGVAFAKSFSAAEVAALAAKLQEHKFEQFQVIFKEGDEGDGMYLIVEGGVKITKKSGEGGEKVLTLLRPGDLFGEFALVESPPRSATAKTVQASTLLSLSTADYQALAAANPALAYKVLYGITQTLAGRLRVASERVASAAQWGSAAGGAAGGEAGGEAEIVSIRKYIDEGTEVRVTFPDGELLGKIRDLRKNDADQPDVLLMDSTQHYFVIPYHSIKYIVSLEKKKSTSKFL